MGTRCDEGRIMKGQKENFEDNGMFIISTVVMVTGFVQMSQLIKLYS